MELEHQQQIEHVMCLSSVKQWAHLNSSVTPLSAINLFASLPFVISLIYWDILQKPLQILSNLLLVGFLAVQLIPVIHSTILFSTSRCQPPLPSTSLASQRASSPLSGCCKSNQPCFVLHGVYVQPFLHTLFIRPFFVKKHLQNPTAP